MGGALHHGANIAAFRLLGPGFPYATLTVNLVGSLAMACYRAGSPEDGSWFNCGAPPRSRALLHGGM
jgi:CrcB protein